MKRFTDNSGNEWTISIKLGTARRVRDVLDVDLLNPASKTDDGSPTSQRLLYDDFFFADVLVELLRDQIDATGKDAAELAADFDGLALKRADEAFWSEYADFFEARGKTWAAKAVKMDVETRAKAAANAEAALVGATSGDSQDAQASTESMT